MLDNNNNNNNSNNRERERERGQGLYRSLECREMKNNGLYTGDPEQRIQLPTAEGQTQFQTTRVKPA